MERGTQIVISGEAPEADLDRLRDTIMSAITEDKCEVSASNPRSAGAISAAQWAKWQVDHAEFSFKPPVTCRDLHDEL